MRYILLISLLLFVHSLQAQQWNWVKKFKTSSQWSQADKLCSDKSGNIYMMGKLYSQALYDSTSIDSGCFVMKMDQEGNLLWQKNIAGWLTDIVVDMTGALYAISTVSDSGHEGYTDINLIKFDIAGNQLLKKIYGGPRDDNAYSITVDSLNNLFITGYYHDSIAFDNQILNQHGLYTHFFIVKINSAGAVQWARNGSFEHNIGMIVKVDKFNNSYVFGRGESLDGNIGNFILKYSPAGDLLMSYFGWGHYSSILGFAIDNSLNIYTITGTSHYYSILIFEKFDSSMNLIWFKYPPESYYAAGIVKGLTLDEENNIYLTGSIGGTFASEDSVIFENQVFHIKGLYDLIVVKYDSAGSLIWHKTAGGTAGEVGTALTIDGDGNLIVAGNFNQNPWSENSSDTVSFDTYTLINDVPYEQLFIAKLVSGFYYIASLDKTKENFPIKIYPNPASSAITISSPEGVLSLSKCTIYNATGEQLISKKLSSQQETVDLSAYPKGVYFIHIISGNNSILKKIILN